ncbi:MAG: ribosome biogenesis protein Nop10 [Candidatus Nitrosocaldaceae archaeon]|jgi:H/ACA ribonucleoprotein complex subunit 3|nr:MAG: ribosome biogenesis protein Nop10 [Candidatus Nitrosocaldaceae archaeon]
MKYLLRRCNNCKRYTLKDVCQICNEKTSIAHPPKFSPDDKYIRYRIADKYK